jgi:hypothetical protein
MTLRPQARLEFHLGSFPTDSPYGSHSSQLYERALSMYNGSKHRSQGKSDLEETIDLLFRKHNWEKLELAHFHFETGFGDAPF